MSLGLGIPWQGALQQSLPPLPQLTRLCKNEASSVEYFSADGTCLTNGVSQNRPQSTHLCCANCEATTLDSRVLVTKRAHEAVQPFRKRPPAPGKCRSRYTSALRLE